MRRLHAAGHADLRTSHGYVVQHVVEGPRPVGEIATRMGITQQAVSKTVGELVGIGYLERTTDRPTRGSGSSDSPRGGAPP